MPTYRGDYVKKIAIWGLGNHAIRNIIPALTASNSTKIVGLWSRNKDVLNNESKKNNVFSYASEEELLGDESIDTILLATPTGLHEEQGLRIIESGKSLWCEKSLFLPDAKNHNIFKIAKSSNLTVNEMFMFLYHPQFMMLKDLLKEGRMGRIFSLSARFCIPHLDSENIRYCNDLGGGSLLDAGCYPIAAAHSLLGPSPVRIHSFIGSEGGFEVDTFGGALFEYEGGQSAFLEWGFGMTYENSLTVRCQNGNISLLRPFSKPSDFISKLKISDSSGNIESIEIPACNHFTIMFDQECKLTNADWIVGQSSLLQKIIKGNSS